MAKYINRSERQVRNVGRSLFWLSGLFLCLSIYSTAKFGWGLGIELDDKVTFATMAAGVDIFGAALMVVCGLCFGRKHYKAGVAAFVGILACGAASALGIYGFQSSNRIGVAHAREKIADLDKGALEWFKSLAVTGPKGDRTDRIGDVKEQLGKLKGSLVELEPDTQATELGATFGVSADSARRAITMGGSVLVLVAQFTCLWFCAYLRQSVEPEIAREDAIVSGNFPETFPETFPRNFRKFSKDEARLDLQRMIDSGAPPMCGAQLALRWGIGASACSKWLDEFGEENLIRRKRIGQQKLVLPATKSNGVLGSNVTTLRRQT